MGKRAFTFEVIIRCLSNQIFTESIGDIYKNHTCFDRSQLDTRTFTYAQFFGFIEKLENKKHWHIKSVAEMCQRLRDLATYRDTRNDDQPLTVPLAFELIIHEFRNGTDSPRNTTEIENHIFNIRENNEDDFEAGSVLCTLRFLNHFGFADKTGHSWRIKSVKDMCQRLHDLYSNYDISN